MLLLRLSLLWDRRCLGLGIVHFGSMAERSLGLARAVKGLLVLIEAFELLF